MPNMPKLTKRAIRYARMDGRADHNYKKDICIYSFIIVINHSGMLTSLDIFIS